MLKKLFCLTGAFAILLACLCGISASAQNRTVRGTVVDAAGAPVVGAAVVVVGNTSIGAVIGVDGSFSLNVPAGSSLEFSCIGYASQVIPVGNQAVINVVLQEDSEFLDETVVIGYGVQRKSDLTGSVASVRSEELMDRSTSDAAAALQGKAAGVQVYTNSGAPGDQAHIRVRGISSNSGSGLGPLMIVDGLKVDNIQYLDPSMIESMEVLKDAASAAIYGAQAGNGVILITTKSGSKSKDGRIFYNYKYTATSLGRYAQVLNAEEFIDWHHRLGTSGFTSREDVISSGKWDGVTDTRWADVLYGKGVTQSHTIGAQGGNDRGSYFVSLNYVNENGMAKGDKDYYKRLTAQVNGDYKIKSWFTVGTNTSIERYQKADIGSPQEYGGTLLGALIIDPLTPVYFKTPDDMPLNMRTAFLEGYEVDGVHYDYQFYGDENGYYSTSRILEGDGMNPLINIARENSKSEGWRVRGTLFANVTPFKGLVFTSRLGYRINQSYSSDFDAPYYVNPKHYEQSYSISSSSSQSYYYQWENFANYNVTLAQKHSIGAMAGMSYTFNDSRSVGASLSGVDPLKGYAENFRYLTQDNGSGKKGISGGQPSNSTQISYFGRLTYGYDNRYNLQVNFRADAFDSSKLSAKNRWGYFPSVSAGWTVSNESFIKDNISRDFLSFLKLRASWGINGNISVLSGYPYSTSISYNDKNYQYHVEDNVLNYGSVPDGLANPDLTWETSVQTDLGLDARFFNNRLTFGFDWFNKDTKDLIVSVKPLAEIGISSSVPVNSGSVNNTGLEFELGWQDNIGDFGYSINGNFSTLKNKVTFLEPLAGESVKSGSHFANYKLSTWFEEGYPLWYLNGFKYAGIGEDGFAQFYDKNGEITQNPETSDRQFLGSTIPSFQYGVTLRLDWKGVDLTVFGTGSGGNWLVPCVYRTEHTQINTLRWYYEHAGKDIPDIPKIAEKVDFWSSDATIFKGDFFKIKQIQLGYTLPQKFTKKILINSLRAYVSLDDWFLFTQYPGFDPEAATTGSSTGRGLDKGNYPNAKKLMFGVNVSF